MWSGLTGVRFRVQGFYLGFALRAQSSSRVGYLRAHVLFAGFKRMNPWKVRAVGANLAKTP